MMKIALAQIDCSLGDVEANCEKISEYAEKATQQGCDVVVFPEMSDTGYAIPVILETASDWSGLPFTTLQQTASSLGIYIICGISEREGENIYNSIAVLSPKGELLGKYRKTHLFSPAPVHEDKCFVPGSSLTTLRIGNMTWGFSICYDLRFPELYRSLYLQGAEVLVNCSAWPASRAMHWEALTRARAIENQAYLIGANRVGKDGGMPFCGRSCIIEPFGKYTASGSPGDEDLVIGEIDREKATSFREKIPVFKSRRGDIYGNLK